MAVNLLGGFPCLVTFLLWVAPPAGGAVWGPVTVFVVAFAAYVAAIGVLTSRRDRQRQRAVDEWLREGAPHQHPLAAGRHIVLVEPQRQATSTAMVWLGGCGMFAAIDYAYAGDALRSLLLVFGALMAGLTTVVVTFFASERMLRPLLAVALAGSAPDERERMLTVRRRLQLAWFVGSGVPVAGIGLTLLWQDLMDDDMSAPLYALVVAGLLAGWVVMGIAGRSVVEPLEDVRTGLRDVEAGDLSISVPVTSRTEVGLLQAGFNRMVDGLRERDRIRHLFGAQVSKPVAAATISGTASFDGRLCDASVVFVDLIGSTALVQAHSAEEVVRLVNALIHTVVRCVEAEGGFVARILGDGALCVFGAIDETADHAARALRAAVAMQEAVARESLTHAGLDVGIAVASGPMVAGLVGTAHRHEFGLVGDPVNEAARLCDVAKQRPGRVLASEAAVFAAGVSGSDGWVPSGRLALRGRSEVTMVFEPVRPDRAPVPQHTPAPRPE